MPAPSDIVVTTLTATAGVGQITLIALWSSPAGMSCLPYVNAAAVDFYASATNDRTTATKVGSSATGLFVHAGLGASATRYYWAQAVDPLGGLGAFFPVSPTAGVSATTSDQVPPANSVGTPQIQNGAVTDVKVTSLSASKLLAGTITATISIMGPTITGGTVQTSSGSTKVVLDGAANSLRVYESGVEVATVGSTSSGAAINIASTGGTAITASGDAVFGGVIEVINAAGTTSGYALQGRHGFNGANNAGGYFDNYAGGGGGIRLGVAATSGGWGAYTTAGGYGPFTGAHDGFLAKGDAAQVGDILLDVKVMARDGVSNVVTQLESGAIHACKRAVGVLASRRDFDPLSDLAAMRTGRHDRTTPSFVKRKIAERYQIITMNSLGEGQINVCGRGGDIEAGDLICTSDLAGKGQRQNDPADDDQADSLVRNYTVARARETIAFAAPDEVRMIACIYLCG